MYMLTKKLIFTVIFTVICYTGLQAQEVRKDKGTFTPVKNEFYEKIKNDLKNYYKKSAKPKIEFKMDFSGMTLPTGIDQFKYQWHNPPISQGRTGTCWSFSATSYYESELYRIKGLKVKLSEMYTVYWEYVEKARRYVRERGNSAFEEGSMLNAIPRIWTKYGIVPEEEYPGLPPDQPFHDHEKMAAEMKHYLESMKAVNFWDEDEILANIKSILNYYLGEPPLKITIAGVEMTPLEYLNNILQINFNSYVDFMSLKQKPYFRRVEYAVQDNWWHDSTYVNVPLDDFMAILKKALNRGYTVGIGGDVSEAGYDSEKEVAMVPTFDIPSSYINEDSRQFRFSNGSTTDDHGIHVVGIMQNKDGDWYLIKDSGSGAQNGPNKGYRFYHSDYIKLKILDLVVNRDIVTDLLQKHGLGDQVSN
jgi:bleomycin hydrolase